MIVDFVEGVGLIGDMCDFYLNCLSCPIPADNDEDCSKFIFRNPDVVERFLIDFRKDYCNYIPAEEWKPTIPTKGNPKCPVCEFELESKQTVNYCPNCGSRMGKPGVSLLVEEHIIKWDDGSYSKIKL